MKLDQGQIDNANVQLAYCRITSPITGPVGLRLVDPGNIVHAADTNGMLVITQLQPINVLFSVAEDYLPQIRQQLHRGNRLTVDAFDRTQQTKLSSGALLTFDNLDRHDHRHDQAESDFSESRQRPFPESIRERASAG